MSLSPVSAVVLSIGEPTTARAVESVRTQTRPVREIIRVDGVSPVHRAFNEGAAGVATPFFIQVDADMVLDRDCVERLSGCLTETVGVVVGHLRDQLYGRVQAVKLFRTDCVRRHPFRDSVSPDTDFIAEITAGGWTDVYALRHLGVARAHWHTFGEHDPAYTPLYTYTKHLAAGRRWRHRRDPRSLEHQLERLHDSPHAAALIARIALGHGVFLDRDHDLLGRCREDADYHRLMGFLGGGGPSAARGRRLAVDVRPNVAFRRFYELGIALGRTRQSGTFQHVSDRLRASGHPWSLLAQIGLSHGLFAEGYDPRAFEVDWAKVREFCPDLGPLQAIGRAARWWLGRARRRQRERPAPGRC